ncbi:MAG: hypothetical protein RLZZ387_1536 [Chloroflexota bacterium]|jgi:hypothetical protein
MRYTIRRIAPTSALRVGCALGWLLALPPALLVAWLVVRAVRIASDSLQGLRDAEVRLPTFDIPVVGLIDLGTVPVDLTGPLGLDDRSRQVAELVDRLPQIFAGTTFALVAVGALAVAAVVVLFSLGYNLLARLGFGLEVELDAAPRRDDAHTR